MSSDDEFGEQLLSTFHRLTVDDVPDVPTFPDVPTTKQTDTSEWKHEQVLLPNINLFPTFQPTSYNFNCKEYLHLFFADSLFDLVVAESNRYALEQKAIKWIPITKQELKAFIGCKIIMSINVLPNLEMYWSKRSFIKGSNVIQSTFSLKRFLNIERYLHCVNNSDFKDISPNHPEFDCFSKIKSIMNVVNANCRSNFPIEQYVTVDESMIAFKGRHKSKVYVKNKPTKWGFKAWSLASSKTGYIIHFEYCKGAFGKSSTKEIVCNLALNLPKVEEKLPYFIHCDRYFTSISLLQCLSNYGMYLTGTIMSNRVGIPKEFQKSSKELVKNTDQWAMHSSGMLLHSFHDTKVVTFLTNRHLPNLIIRKRKRGQVQQLAPEVLVDYNKNARGVDLHDQYMSYYPTARKCRKWWKYLFWNMFDICLSNALQIKNIQVGIDGKRQTQLEFRIKLAEELIGSFSSRKQKKYSKQQMSDRYVGRHFPAKGQTATMCAVCNKVKRVRTIYTCKQCQIHLCPVPCFELYHTKEATVNQ